MTPGEISGLRERLAAGSGENTDPLKIANAILDDNVSHPDPDSDICVLARQVIRRTEILHRALDALDSLHAKIAELEGERDAASARVGELEADNIQWRALVAALVAEAERNSGGSMLEALHNAAIQARARLARGDG